MSELDLFAEAEEDAPKFCRVCAFRLADLHAPTHYCDLSKQTVQVDAPACREFRRKE
jgi:hypothetical protein